MIHKVESVLACIVDKLTFALLIFIPLLVVVQVFLRYVLKAPLMGIEELLLFPTIWLYMLGGATASRNRNHIECGILSLYVKRPTSMAIFKVTRALISVILSLWLTYWAHWFFAYSFKVWKLSDLLYIPLFLGESAIFIGLLLMTLYAIIELLETTLSAGHTRTKEGETC